MGLRLPRLIPRLDIKGENVVKGVQMEGLRIVGRPEELARRYAEEADELLYVDIVASLYGRSQLEGLLERTTDRVFIPITVAGGIRSREEVRRLLRVGADKVAINTAAIRRPALIRECANYFGSQAIVISVEARKLNGGWEALTDNGRERTGKDALEWIKEAVTLGAGEVLITSVDRDGTRKGFDLELVARVTKAVKVPVIACGGLGSAEDAKELYAMAKPDGIATGSALHYGKLTLQDLRAAFPDICE